MPFMPVRASEREVPRTLQPIDSAGLRPPSVEEAGGHNLHRHSPDLSLIAAHNHHEIRLQTG